MKQSPARRRHLAVANPIIIELDTAGRLVVESYKIEPGGDLASAIQVDGNVIRVHNPNTKVTLRGVTYEPPNPASTDQLDEIIFDITNRGSLRVVFAEPPNHFTVKLDNGIAEIRGRVNTWTCDYVNRSGNRRIVERIRTLSIDTLRNGDSTANVPANNGPEAVQPISLAAKRRGLKLGFKSRTSPTSSLYAT